MVKKCGHKWQATVYNRTSGTNCPICSRDIVSKKRIAIYIEQRGDLATNEPELIKEWHPTKNGNLNPTDTIEDDFEDDIVKVWRCPECGCVMSFEGEGKVKNSFMVSSDKYLGSTYEEGIAFDDYLWDEITEGAKPNNAMQTQSRLFMLKYVKWDV